MLAGHTDCLFFAKIPLDGEDSAALSLYVEHIVDDGFLRPPYHIDKDVERIGSRIEWITSFVDIPDMRHGLQMLEISITAGFPHIAYGNVDGWHPSHIAMELGHAQVRLELQAMGALGDAKGAYGLDAYGSL